MNDSSAPEGYLTSLTRRGFAFFIGITHPFPYDDNGNLREGAEEIRQEIPAGWTISDALRETKMLLKTPSYAGILVRVNGLTLCPDDYDSIAIQAGDRIIARAMPREPASISAFFAAIGSAIAGTTGGVGVGGFLGGVVTGFGGGLTGAGLGTAGFGLGSAIGAGIGVGSLIGSVVLYAGASFLLSLATRALVGSPDSGGTGGGATKRISPTASGAGNQILPDHPVFRCYGDVRVAAPHIAIPFQPGYVGGKDQDPALRELLGVGGDCLISELKLGKTDIALLEIEATTFQNETTLNFPTALVKRPGITIKDWWYDDKSYSEQTENRFEVVATDDEVDELDMIWLLPSGLNRVNQKGVQKQWQLSFDLEYRVAVTGNWTGFFAKDQNGNTANVNVPFVQDIQSRGDNRLHITGKTAEPFFLYIHRKVVRARYEVRFRLRREEFYLKADGTDQQGDRIVKAHWPRDRWNDYDPDDPKQKDDTDTGALSSDPQLIQFAGFRNEPAIENFTPGLSGVEVTLIDQTTKSDESSHLSFRCRNQIPDLRDGSGDDIWRTAKTTTSNPASVVLDILTGPFAGSTAVPNSKIDFPSFWAAYQYCNTPVPASGGGTEPLHRCDCVLDRSGIGRLEQVTDILRNFRMKLTRMDGKYHLVVDEKRDAPRMLFAETDILEMESERTWAVIPDMLRVEFFNAEKDGEKDELHEYNDSQPVTGVLEHGGFAAKTAAITSVSTTLVRDGDYVTITRVTGDFSALPEEGWVEIRDAGAWAGGKMFRIDGVSGDLLSLTVIDADQTLVTTGTRTQSFHTTVAEVIESLSLPYSQRPSECHREARYFLAQKLRPEVYSIHLGLEWMTLARGDMIEVNSSVPVWGAGSGRVLGIEGTLTACTAVQMDEEFAHDEYGFPVVKFVTWNGTAIVTNRYDIHIANTDAKRSATGDNRWLSFASPQNFQTIGLKVGDGNGSVGVFGERTYETKELIVQDIVMGRDLSATLRCVDHAPEMFDAILDQAPMPAFDSGIWDTNIGERARPAAPEVSASIDGPSTGMTSITAYNVNDPDNGLQRFIRSTGSFIDDGFTGAHRVTIEGFSNAANNKIRVGNASPSETQLNIVTLTGVAEAGTGDERIRGVTGSLPQTLSIRRAACGLTALEVANLGGGEVYLEAGIGSGRFSGFEAAGFCEISGMSNPENNGFFAVTGILPNGDGIILNSNTMVDEVGNGKQACHQSMIRRPTGSFITDGIQPGDRVAPGGFEQKIDALALTVRQVSATALAVDDPFGRLVTETGSGDETVTVVKVPVAYEVEMNQSAGNELRLFVTVPLRPGVKSVVSIEEIETFYRLRDRVTGRTTGGWSSAGTIPANSSSATFGPIPSTSDWDFAARSISKAGTSSEWMVITGNGPSDRPSAPTVIQVHSDSVATAEGNRFALRVEWDGAPQVLTYLLRYQREGDDGWQSLLVYDKTEAIITDVRIGTYDFELYTLASNGQPSDVLTHEFDWEPDRDFENTTVTNLRLVNHASEASAAGIDPLYEFTGQDVLLSCVEPDFSGEVTPGDTADINGILDPLVRELQWEVFDPATGTVLRTDIRRDRDYRYTRDMNAEDQTRVMTRGPYRDLGFRVRMQSTTNRTSAPSQIAVSNPRPPVPAGISLSSTPGNSGQLLDAIVHVIVNPGQSKKDPDFSRYGVWASTTPGFTPGPSNFKGMTSGTSNAFSFPAASGVTVYVRVGGLDMFHPIPELIADPVADVALLNEQSTTTVDGATFPVHTDDIAADAVTEFGTVEVTIGNSTPLSIECAPNGKLSVIATATGNVVSPSNPDYTLLFFVQRNYSPASVLYYNGASWIDYTTEAASGGAGEGDVPGPKEAGLDALYLGNEFPWGQSAVDVINVEVGTTNFDETSVLAFYVWDSVSQDWALTAVTDTTDSLDNTGTWRLPASLPNWGTTTVNGVGPWYWIKIVQTGTTQTANFPIRRIYNYSTIASNQMSNSVDNKHQQLFVAMSDHGNINGTKTVETLTLTCSGNNMTGIARLTAWAGKDQMS